MVRRVLASDLMRICFWYKDRGLTPPSLGMFPEIGFIEHDTAAGFLYRTDSSLVLLDAYISNHRAPLRKRYRAFAQITDELLDCARKSGAAQVLAVCKSRGIQKLSSRFGLRPIGVYPMTGRSL